MEGKKKKKKGTGFRCYKWRAIRIQPRSGMWKEQGEGTFPRYSRSVSADKKDGRISAEINKRELTRKYETFSICAPLEVEVALLQSGCNRKFSQKSQTIRQVRESSGLPRQLELQKQMKLKEEKKPAFPASAARTEGQLSKRVTNSLRLNGDLKFSAEIPRSPCTPTKG